MVILAGVLLVLQGIQDIAYYLSPSPVSMRRRRRADLRQLLRDVGEEQYDVDGHLRRHSVQVGPTGCRRRVRVGTGEGQHNVQNYLSVAWASPE